LLSDQWFSLSRLDWPK